MDKLDAEICSIMREFELPRHDWAVARLREDIDFAAECVRDTASLRLRTADAIKLEHAATAILNLARQHLLESEANLSAVRRLRREARRRLLVTDRPAPRIWLWHCCTNFQGAWEEFTDRPSGIYYDIAPSPTLLFATACCQLVDPSVKPTAIMRAKRDYSEPEEMTPEEWEAFQQSDFWQKFMRLDL